MRAVLPARLPALWNATIRAQSTWSRRASARCDGNVLVTSTGGRCEAGNGPEKIFLYENPHNARLEISVDHPETIERTTREQTDDLKFTLLQSAGRFGLSRGEPIPLG